MATLHKGVGLYVTIWIVIAPGIGSAAEVAKSPSELVQLVNSRAAFDAQAMGDVPDTAGDALSSQLRERTMLGESRHGSKFQADNRRPGER